MADLTTLNYGWVKPNVNDPAGVDLWGGKLNADLDGIDATTFTNAQAIANINASMAGGFVNKFRNPGFDHWQRGSSVNAAVGAYTADGWILGFGGAAGPLTVSRQVLAAGGASAGVAGASGLNVIGAAGITACNLVQRIESFLSAQLTPGQPITVSYWIGPNIPITPQLQIAHPTALDNFAAVTVDVGPVALQPCSANTWTRVAYTFTLPVGVQQSGLSVWLMLGAIGTASVTVAAADIRTTPGVAVGLNANPPPPELRPVSVELVLCHRYLVNMLCTANGYGTAGLAITCPENRFPGPMRATPGSLTPSSITYANSSALNLAPLGGQGVNASITVTATGNAYATFSLLASAEL